MNLPRNPYPMISVKDIERLLADSRDTTNTTLDELAVLRTVLALMCNSFSYADALSMAHEQVQLSKHN